MNSILLVSLFGLAAVGIIYFLFKIPYAIKNANAGKPYNPRQQMVYNHKTKQLEFFSMSQRTAWWITFWDNI